MKTLLSLLIVSVILPACSDQSRDVHAKDKAAQSTEAPSAPKPNDSGRNVPDKSAADLELSQRIRQALVEDSQLSMDARNVKITALNGVVTLQGPVRDQTEMDNVIAKAKAVAGVREIDNQLEISDA